jgi:hypothetical protein
MKFIWEDWIWAGDVIWPINASDKAIVTFNWTTGKLIQSSNVHIDDFWNIYVDWFITTQNSIYSWGTGDESMSLSWWLIFWWWTYRQIWDSSFNELIKFPLTSIGSAINEFTISNAPTWVWPKLEATWNNTNIDINLQTKWTWVVKINWNTQSWTNTWDETTTTLWSKINLATEKTTPVDNDMVWLMDSDWSNILKKLSWIIIKTTLKTYFDSLTTTLTNKRITKRVVTTTQSATPAINTDNWDVFTITWLAQNITSFTMSWTPTADQQIIINITDNWTARTITWGTSFEASTVTLPTTTVISTLLKVGFIRNTVTSKWRCVAVA